MGSSYGNKIRRRGCNNPELGLSTKEVYHMFGGICQECDCTTILGLIPQQPNSATVEHKMPISDGGKHSRENVTLFCSQCNSNANRAKQMKDAPKKQKLWNFSFALFGYRLIIKRLPNGKW